MNEQIYNAILNEIIEISADNATRYKIKKTMEKIEEIVDGKKDR